MGMTSMAKGIVAIMVLVCCALIAFGIINQDDDISDGTSSSRNPSTDSKELIDPETGLPFATSPSANAASVLPSPSPSPSISRPLVDVKGRAGVASDNAVCDQIGMKTMEQGGNAVDAAVATSEYRVASSSPPWM
jgi:hypothetical protein